MAIRIKLRGKDGKFHFYEEKNVSAQKMLDMLDLNPANYPELSRREFYEKQIDFTASLFKDKRVTRQAILNGLMAWELDSTLEDIAGQLMGYDPKVTLESESPETMLETKS